MAAYASLLSLGHILDQLIQHPPRQRAVLDRAQIDYLLENITFLQDFLEEFSLVRGDEIQALEEKISRSAYAAEDIIEKRVVDQILENSEEERSREIFSHLNHFLKKILRSSSLYSRDLQKVIEEFGSMKKDVMKIKETERVTIVQKPRKDATAGSFIRGASDGKNAVVGFREDLNQIMETLTGDESNLQILSIVGMGGIGKTTLARNVFDNPLTVHHFDLRAWVTISQQYSKHEILLGLLEEIGEEITEVKEDHELGLRLHKILSGRRYFIVMDDVWSAEVWDGIKRFFPDNNNGSRVMVTTRLSNVADSFQSCTPHRLHLLNEVKSWALFCHKVFGKESCPRELEEVGRTIVRNCSGLPLAIVTISGLLAKLSRTVEHWEYVANDTHAALNMGGDELCFEILSLSYKHLPVHLKPCFLYMAVFPEDSKIRISRLVKLWVAEGMLKPRSCRSVEEIAEDNLKDLVDRNLIQVHDYGSRNKMKTCTIHDLLRDVCLTEARKEKFLRVSLTNDLNSHSGIINIRRPLIIRRSSDREELTSTYAKLHRLQKILKMGYICSDEEIVRLVNSRYIDYNAGTFSDLLNTLESLSLLWNLQTVTIAGTLRGTAISLPAEIWEMPQLRHLNWKEGAFSLPDPPSTNSENGRRDAFVLKNLQTLCNIRSFRFTDEVTHRIPNLKKIGITYSDFPGFFELDFYDVHNLAHFHNLESLFLKGDENVWQNLCFPHSLKKLTLNHCGLCWEDMTVVGSLPHLEVLNLMSGAVIGREWNTVEGQFLELKSLRIHHSPLEEWITDSSHFPLLENLKLSWLSHLKEIPYGIGEIQTLRSISLVGCSDSVISSARNIQGEQQDLGNYHLLLHVR